MTPPPWRNIGEVFLSRSIDDRRTRETVAELYRREGYLIDPHGAVALTALLDVQSDLATDSLSLCLATAHPSKLPRVVADPCKCQF